MSTTSASQNGTNGSHATNGSNGTNGSTPKFDIHTVIKIEKDPGVKVAEGHEGLRAVSIVDLPAGALFSPIQTATNVEKPTYLTVQTGANSHILLNSDLHYINHSCRPNLEFDMSKFEIRVARDLEGGLKAGDELSFFYPSTEWSMDQPFNCFCKKPECLKTIQGAKYLTEEQAEKYWLNEHIVELRKANAA